MRPTDLHLDTRLIHAAEPEPRLAGAVVAPIFHSATFLYRGGEGEVLRYGRYQNSPTHELLGQKIAALEGCEAGLVTASGMAAIAGSLLSVLGAGDHLLAQEGLYGGTHVLVHEELRRLGIAVDAVPPADPAAWRAALRPTTRALYLESLSNPLLRVPDLARAVEFAREHDLVTIVDNTFATPINLRPAELGFDLVVHSATKYLNGHSDLVAGAVAGGAARIERVLRQVKVHGGCLDAQGAAWLARGLKTLGVRVRRQNESALALARKLASCPRVRAVHHPLLASHPDHERAKTWMEATGGMLSFELDGERAAVDRFLGRLELFLVAPSLGGVESLVSIPVRTSHAMLTRAERRELGIGEGLVRLSVGLEDARDLWADLESALE